MNIAFLFDADHDDFDGYYGIPIMKLILQSGIANSDRNMRVSIGDILTTQFVSSSQERSVSYLKFVCEKTYSPINFNRLYSDKLDQSMYKKSVFCWLFQNMDSTFAENVHTNLCSLSEAYLGAMDVDFSNEFHLQFFRNSLIESYRIKRDECSIFYSMGNIDECKDYDIERIFEQYGFAVSYEDRGLRKTIFDKYDDIKHFHRISRFKNYFINLPNLNENLVDDLIHNLEELHPELFDIFAAATKALQTADTKEEVAQAALSGRRFLESFANYIFPPQNESFNGRDVGKSNYKNRLWAYVEKTLKELRSFEEERLELFGARIDSLVKVFCSGLHSEISKENLETEFANLVILISDMIALKPSNMVKPYLAYRDEILGMLHEAFRETN